MILLIKFNQETGTSICHCQSHSILYNRVVVTGIYRAMPVRLHPRARTVRSVFKTHIDVIHFRKADARRLRERDEEEEDEGYIMSYEVVNMML